MSKPVHPRRAGFRFSVIDGAFILLMTGAFFLLRESMGVFVWMIPVAVAHFFLFCNVFRLRRSYELIWVGILSLNLIGWILFEAFTWWGVLAIQMPATAVLIAMEMRSPRYHGIFCRRLNGKNLEKWLSGEIR